jgi:PEP-CTERM motif
MKRLLGSFVVAACLTTSASLANAATVTDLGALSPTAFGNWGFNVTTNGSIDQIYEFSIAAPTLITISESNSGPGTLTNGILDLFSGTPPASSPALTSAAIGPANQPAQSALIGNPNGFSLTAGSYFFEVTGTLSGLPPDRTEPFSGTYSLSPDLAPGVPEPATFALMSLGLLTVGFASYRRRRSQGLSIRFI